MSNSQIERNAEDSKYLREPEYYVSMMISRFAGQDFTSPHYDGEDVTKFLYEIFHMKAYAPKARIVDHDIDKVRIYKSRYIPSREDEVLTEEEEENLYIKLKKKDAEALVTVIANAEIVARSISEAPSDLKKTAIVKYAKNILIKIVRVLKLDRDVTAEGRESIAAIFAMLGAKEQ